MAKFVKWEEDCFEPARLKKREGKAPLLVCPCCGGGFDFIEGVEEYQSYVVVQLSHSCRAELFDLVISEDKIDGVSLYWPNEADKDT